MKDMKLGFELKKVQLALADILPVRKIKEPYHDIKRYRTIRASIKEVGLVEPLVVYPQKGVPGKYILLDGHLRFVTLKDLGHTEADCIIANDDESFTYNARVNRLNSISGHKMIMKAVQNGVNLERIAAALNLDVNSVRASMTLLDGINAEAADLLKDKAISPKAIRLMKKVTAVRQIEIAELMISVNTYTKGYTEALIMGTPKDQLLHPDEPKRKEGMTCEQIAKMEREMETQERDFKTLEGTYGENMLNLTLARGFIKKILNNAKVLRFLTANYPDMLAEFDTIVGTEAI